MLAHSLWIAWTEIRKRWIALLGTALFSSIIGFIIGSMMNAYMNDPQAANMNPVLLDYILIVLIPSLGTLSVSREYLSWSSMTGEPYLKRLSFLRMWPIPLTVIIWSRLLYSISCFVIMFIFLFGALTAIGWFGFLPELGIGSYMAFVLFWFGYGIAFCGFNAFVEFSISGKIIFLSTLIVAIGILVVLSILHIFSGYFIFLVVIDLAEQFSILTIVAMAVIGILGLFGWKHALQRRILRLDLP